MTNTPKQIHQFTREFTSLNDADLLPASQNELTGKISVENLKTSLGVGQTTGNGNGNGNTTTPIAKTILYRSDTVTLYMDSGGDDLNDGSDAANAIATFTRLNQLLSGYEMQALSSLKTGDPPQINIVMGAGTYEGGVLHLPTLGQGYIVINSSSQVIVLGSVLALIDCSSMARFTLNNATFDGEGTGNVATYFSSRLFTPYGSAISTTTSGSLSYFSRTNTAGSVINFLIGRFPVDNAFEHMAVIATGGSHLVCQDCTINDTTVNGGSLPVVADNLGRIDLRDCIYKGSTPFMYSDNGGKILARNMTLDRAAATLIRYLGSLGHNAEIRCDGSLTLNNVTVDYAVRGTSGGTVTLNEDWSNGISKSAVDQLYLAPGIRVISFPGGAAQTINYRTLLKPNSGAIDTDEQLGSHHFFFGAGTIAEVKVEGNKSNTAVKVGQDVRVSVSNGAQINLTVPDANMFVFLNNQLLTGPVNTPKVSTGQTTIACEYLSSNTAVIHVLEGELT